jgi:hypothetical protein
MGKGIIRVDPKKLKDDFEINIMRSNPRDVYPIDCELAMLKAVLLLPAHYNVDSVKQVHQNLFDSDFVEITVSSEDIPDVPNGETLPSVEPWYLRSDKGEVTLTKVLIDPLAHSEGEKLEVLLADRMLKEMDLELDRKMKEGNWHGND